MTEAMPMTDTEKRMRQGIIDAECIVGASVHHHADTVEMAQLAIDLNRQLRARDAALRAVREVLQEMKDAALYVCASGAKSANATLRREAEKRYLAANERARAALGSPHE